MSRIVGIFFLVVSLCSALTAGCKMYTTHRLQGPPPVIDGQLSDSVWENVAWGGDFVQKHPYEGSKPSQQTAFKILYDNRNLYVGIRAYDTDPHKIERRMSRRDNREGDWVEIILDSYYDHRTGFAFSVNAAGVRIDSVVSGDGDRFDGSWDPVWLVKTSTDTKGWLAEMRIPLTQLRFKAKESQTWGLHLARFLHRNEELVEWNLIPTTSSGFVSGFGELHGLDHLDSKRQIELLPYSVGKFQLFEDEEGNPFATGSDKNVTGGLDGKVGITSNLTLNFTVNPDFGQVEADPSEVNLTTFETFLEEKRPFFVEGRNILNFQVTGGSGGFSRDNLFYSRRIGRTPQHEPDTEDNEFLDIPENTTILAAFKLTGKTKHGLSIGILESLTAKENAALDFLGDRRQEAVEPMTNYFLFRLQKDFNKGNTSLGGIVTATNRNLKDPGLKFLHHAAYSGGLDFLHKWKNKEWHLSLNTIFSNVRGDKEALQETQESSRRYFQRPDADYITYDPQRTSLSGHGGTVSLGKTGGRLRFITDFTWRSPGLELNDMGYLRIADRMMYVYWTGYRFTKPFGIFRNLYLNHAQWRGWNFGGERLFAGGTFNFDTQLKNYWSVGAGLKRQGKSLSTTALRGGPSFKLPGGWEQWLFISSDSRKKMRLRFGTENIWGDSSSNRSTRVWCRLAYRPFDVLAISMEPSFQVKDSNLQYVETIEQTGETDRYIFSRLRQKTLAVTLRLNYSITPDLSIQFYGQPFISSGKYDAFKHIIQSRADTYEDRYYTFAPAELSYDAAEEYFNVAEAGGRSYEFEDPNFNFLQFSSNLVIRWEYTPGSTLYLVWSQGRTDTLNYNGDFSFKRDWRHLFHIHPHNVFLLKFPYRFKL
ncbi:MAG: carbohydrate binding family 9 domain-containing protein [bacterium]|nr:carbohydrate binding family 9 domain-containing protein [bacterium]